MRDRGSDNNEGRETWGWPREESGNLEEGAIKAPALLLWSKGSARAAQSLRTREDCGACGGRPSLSGRLILSSGQADQAGGERPEAMSLLIHMCDLRNVQTCTEVFVLF